MAARSRTAARDPRASGCRGGQRRVAAVALIRPSRNQVMPRCPPRSNSIAWRDPQVRAVLRGSSFPCPERCRERRQRPMHAGNDPRAARLRSMAVTGQADRCVAVDDASDDISMAGIKVSRTLRRRRRSTTGGANPDQRMKEEKAPCNHGVFHGRPRPTACGQLSPQAIGDSFVRATF